MGVTLLPEGPVYLLFFRTKIKNVRKIQNFTNLQPVNFNLLQDLKIAAFWENPEKIRSTFSKTIFLNQQNRQTFQQFLTNKLRSENGAKECIV